MTLIVLLVHMQILFLIPRVVERESGRCVFVQIKLIFVVESSALLVSIQSIQTVLPHLLWVQVLLIHNDYSLRYLFELMSPTSELNQTLQSFLQLNSLFDSDESIEKFEHSIHFVS